MLLERNRARQELAAAFLVQLYTADAWEPARRRFNFLRSEMVLDACLLAATPASLHAGAAIIENAHGPELAVYKQRVHEAQASLSNSSNDDSKSKLVAKSHLHQMLKDLPPVAPTMSTLSSIRAPIGTVKPGHVIKLPLEAARAALLRAAGD